MPECQYCCRSGDDAEIQAHIASVHTDGRGQVIASSVVDKISNQRLVSVLNRTVTVTVGRELNDSHTLSAHPLLTRYMKLVVYRRPPAMGAPTPAPVLYAFERTQATAYGDPPEGYELVWIVGEWSLAALGNTLVRV